MKTFEDSYIELINQVIHAAERETRAGIAQSIFGVQLDIREMQIKQFPLLLGRKIFWQSVAGEVAAVLKGPKNLKSFTDEGCNYWKPWADAKGNLIVDYGNAWLDFNGVNQLEAVVKSLKDDPMGRRHMIVGWKPDRLKALSLPCCHYAYQWYVSDGLLHMLWIQRSVDVMVGLPSDVVFAGIFNALMAQTVGLKPGKIVMQFGDTHIYSTHLKAMEKYLMQAANTYLFSPVSWTLDPKATVFNFKPEMFNITGYEPEAAITFEMAV